MSLISSAASLGFGLGPVVGGALTQWWGWNALFVVTTLVLLLIPLYRKWLPIESRKSIDFDAIGAILTAIGVAGTLAYLVSFKWWLLALTLLTYVLLWWHIHRPTEKIPFIQPALLKHRKYLMLLFMGFAGFSTHFAILFLMPIILASLFGRSPAAIGMIIFPGAMLSAVAAIFIGRAIDRFGNAPLIQSGHIFLGASAVIFALFSGVAPFVILFTYMLTSIGFTSMTSSLANEVSRILDKALVGAGMGMIQLVQFIGGAIGVTMAGLFLEWSSGMDPKMMYRNIFLIFATLLLSSLLIFYGYKRQEKID